MRIIKYIFKGNSAIDSDPVDYDSIGNYAKRNITTYGGDVINGSSVYVDMDKMDSFEYHYPVTSDMIKQYLKLKNRSKTIKNILST